MQVSVVLCTYDLDQYDHFVETADGVLAQTHDDIELVIVVDGRPNLADRVRSDYGARQNVAIHCNDENRGLLHSRNTGADLATGEVVAFVDDDVRPEPEWAARLAAVYETRDRRAVGGRITPAWVAGRPNFFPAEFYWLVGVTHRGFGPGGDSDAAGEVRNTFGSNISFRRDTFQKLGGFDPAIGGRKGDVNLQGGETELCARLQERYGEGVWYAPDARVAHKVFAYRTDPWWLLDRAFWQGYSKRAMEQLVPDSGGEERAFLGRLLAEFLPRRLRGLVVQPSVVRASQLVALVVLTAAVGIGYCYGLLNDPGTTS